MLAASDIPYLDFREVFRQDGTDPKDLFFITDHHWKPTSGFIATNAICRKLNDLYGFSVNEIAADLSHYNVTVLKNQFLGSYGKKVGTYFTWYGADDFELIIPNFDTHLTEEIPSENSFREGKFEDTVLHKTYLKKDYYSMSTYCAYSGGDYRLQIVKNHLNPNGKKIVILRDSYSCVITPFLALQANELHIIDDRKGDYPPGDAINIEEYIGKEKPDYVIVVQ